MGRRRDTTPELSGASASREARRPTQARFVEPARGRVVAPGGLVLAWQAYAIPERSSNQENVRGEGCL